MFNSSPPMMITVLTVWIMIITMINLYQNTRDFSNYPKQTMPLLLHLRRKTTTIMEDSKYLLILIMISKVRLRLAPNPQRLQNKRQDQNLTNQSRWVVDQSPTVLDLQLINLVDPKRVHLDTQTRELILKIVILMVSQKELK